MKANFFRYLVGLGIVLSMVSCGNTRGKTKETDTTKENDSNKTSKSVEIINQDNFVSIAKFSFLKESQRVSREKAEDTNNNSKFRTTLTSSNMDISNEKSLKITSITPFDKYVRSMTISAKNSKIKIDIKDKLYAVISFYKDGELVESKKQSMKKFSSFDIKGFGEEL